MAGIDPISNVADAAEKIIALFVADPNIKAKVGADHVAALDQQDLVALQGQIQAVLGQIQVNAVEAANKSVFVAGWRPWVGWVCGTALGTPFLVYLLRSLVVIVRGALSGHFDPIEPPDTTVLLATLGSILGLGGMRTYEKASGVDTQNK